jgi:hypothetical protein
MGSITKQLDSTRQDGRLSTATYLKPLPLNGKEDFEDKWYRNQFKIQT